jgi:hypothetical protein
MEKKDVFDLLERKMKFHEEQMNQYSDEVTKVVDQEGEVALTCDYVMHRRLMTQYHRGSWTVLRDLKNSLEKM